MALHVRKRRKLENNESQDIITLLDLPNEILAHTLSYVITDLKKVAVRETCKRFRDVIDEHLIDKSLYYHAAFFFRFRAIDGNLDACIWLYNRFKLKSKDALSNFNSLIYAIVQHGHLDVCRWLDNTFDLSFYDNHNEKVRLFCKSARNGHLELCRWLYENSNLTPFSQDISIYQKGHLIAQLFHVRRKSCHLDILKLLYEELYPKTKHIRADLNHTFQFNAQKGCLNNLKWLEKWGISYIDVRECGDKALSLSIKNNHLDICIWLVTTFHITKKNVLIDICHHFSYCAEHGYFRMCMWLYKTFDFTAKNITCAKQVSIFEASAKNGHLDICKWLYEIFHFNFILNEIMISKSKDIFTLNVTNGNLKICQWLNTTFQHNSGTLFGFISAMENGRLDICKWLYEISSPKYYTVCKPLMPFTLCMGRGYLDVCKWAQEVWNITAKDMMTEHNFRGVKDAFLCNLNYNRLEMCEWIHETFHITVEDIRSYRDEDEFPVIVNNDQLYSFIWLIETFELTKEDTLRKDGNIILESAAYFGDLTICEWLHKKFGFTIRDACTGIMGAIRGNRYSKTKNYLCLCKWFYDVIHPSNSEKEYLIKKIKKRSNSDMTSDIKKWISEISY